MILQEIFYKIGNVIIDKSYYKKEYDNDNIIENEILSSIKTNSYEHLLAKDNRWEILYNLYWKRENILSGISFRQNPEILEIGCGCGSITGLLCKKSKSVTAVEISGRRAEIAAYKNKNYENLKIIVGNIKDIKLEKKFDYVTLIGVLEHAGLYYNGNEAWSEFLKLAKNFLKPDGIMIIAIENRLGLKYWCGDIEEHSGMLFEGILGYPNSTTVKTFSRNELISLLHSVGLYDYRWFYPYPDYKFPTDIYTDEYMPQIEHLEEELFNKYPKKKVLPELEMFKSIISAGLYKEFSNSFLVLCSNDKNSLIDQPEYIHFSHLRKMNTAICTLIQNKNGKKVIYKIATTDEQKRHLEIIAENCQILNKMYGKEHVAQCKFLDETTLEMEYIDGEKYDDLMIRALNEDGPNGLSEYIDFYCKNILKGQPDTQTDIEYDFMNPHRKYNVDLHFENIIVSNNNYIIIDYEWLNESIPTKYVLYRALVLFYTKKKNVLNQYNIDIALLLEAIGITEMELKKYMIWNNEFVLPQLDEYLFQYVKDNK